MHSPLEDWAFSMAARVFFRHTTTHVAFCTNLSGINWGPRSITPFFLTTRTLENRLKKQKKKQTNPVFLGNSLLLFDKSSNLPSSPGVHINWVNSDGRIFHNQQTMLEKLLVGPASEIISYLAILGVANWAFKLEPKKCQTPTGWVIIDPFFGSANGRRRKWSWRFYFLASAAEWVTTCNILEPTVVESLKSTAWKTKTMTVTSPKKTGMSCSLASYHDLLELKISSKGQRHRPLLGQHREIHMTWHHQHVQPPFRAQPLDG